LAGAARTRTPSTTNY
ncbi:hypothetical protein BAE44_0000520, partial [Dichanthelium oligosanthes]